MVTILCFKTPRKKSFWVRLLQGGLSSVYSLCLYVKNFISFSELLTLPASLSWYFQIYRNLYKLFTLISKLVWATRYPSTCRNMTFQHNLVSFPCLREHNLWQSRRFSNAKIYDIYYLFFIHKPTSWLFYPILQVSVQLLTFYFHFSFFISFVKWELIWLYISILELLPID